MKISFGEIAAPKSGTVAVGVLEKGALTPSAAELDKASDGTLRRAIAGSRFSGKKNELLAIPAPANLPQARVLLVGLGKAKEIDARQMQDVGGAVLAQLNAGGDREAAVLLDAVAAALSPAEAAANFAYGALLRSYRFDRYRTREK